MRYTVTTPAPGFSGARAGVMFHNGHAVVDDQDVAGARALAYFRRRGYEVTPVESGPETPADQPPSPEPEPETPPADQAESPAPKKTSSRSK